MSFGSGRLAAPAGRDYYRTPQQSAAALGRPIDRSANMELPHLILARMYEHIGPIDRGKRYEDPLDAVLQSKSLGRVTGGGSQLNKLGGIAYADVEIELANLENAVQAVAEVLDAAGAPQGSELIAGDDGRVLREFGSQQCLAIYLDGTSLPDEVYAELDFEAVVEEIGAAAGEGSYRGFWQGREETAIFFFAPDAEAMFARVEPILRRLPIGQNARVVVRAGKPNFDPREMRMPRHQVPAASNGDGLRGRP